MKCEWMFFSEHSVHPWSEWLAENRRQTDGQLWHCLLWKLETVQLCPV